MEEKIATLIVSSPYLETLVIKEKELMYSIIFQQQPTRSRLLCRKRKKNVIPIPKNTRKDLKCFFELRDNRQAVLNSKLLFYLSQLIKVLEADNIFQVSPPEMVRL